MSQISTTRAAYNRPNPSHLYKSTHLIPCLLVKHEGSWGKYHLTTKAIRAWAAKMPDIDAASLLIRLINGNTIVVGDYLLRLQH